MTHRNRTFSFIRLIPAIAGIILAGTASADALEQFEPAYLGKAQQALEQNQPERALATLAAPEPLPVNRRDLAELHGLRCQALVALDRPLEAINACEAAIETRGSSATWRFHNNRGVAHLMLDDLDAAETSFKTARALNARSLAPRRNLHLLSAHREATTPSLLSMASLVQ